MSYILQYEKRVFKDLDRIPKRDLIRIDKAIQSLAVNPLPMDVKKLVGETQLFRVRQGDYRIIYSIDPVSKMVQIIAVRHRKEAYR
ncbi:MAG: type II toxin-antitoxin system RelE/ParE family toxin [Deltaproteobacteria bacterium]|nr:type II toxin-antitoxin system RelE/ParE family toxin [Deltaproteobacteria bacterium]